MSDWTPRDRIIPPPPPKDPPPVDEIDTPTPEEVAADVAQRQADLDAQRLDDLEEEEEDTEEEEEDAANAAATAEAERSTIPQDSTQKWSAPASAPSDPAEAALRSSAAARLEDPTAAVAPPSAAPIPAPARPAPAPPPPTRTPKFLLGATIKIPGGFAGRVVGVFNSWEEMIAHPGVIAAGGPEKVLRGKNGTAVPSTKAQPFYRCRSNRFDYDLVCGELEANLIAQGTGAPQQ